MSEEALTTASFAWLHLSYPSILLTVQKYTRIIMINTNLLVLISLDRVLQETETLLLLRLDNAIFAQRLRCTWETLNCTWIIYLALVDFPPAVSGKLRSSKRWRMAKWRSVETEAPWMGSSSPGDHWSPRGNLNIRRSKELQLRLHIWICDDDVASSLDNLSVWHQPNSIRPVCVPLYMPTVQTARSGSTVSKFPFTDGFTAQTLR